MRRFRYAGDPLCLLACVGYAFGRWFLRQRLQAGFWHDQFTDLLLIPAALPCMLWVQRRLGLRQHDDRPSWREVGLHLAVWSFAAEVAGPLLFPNAVADWRDAVAYGVGAAFAGGWWTLA